MHDETSNPLDDLDAFVAIPRLAGLALSHDGQRLATSIAELDAERKKWVTALWEIDLGGGPARRLTRSAPGEAAPRFAPDGSLLFLSKRADPDAKPDGDDPKPSLWSLPAGGGEARRVAGRSAGLSGFGVARGTGDVVVLTSVAPDVGDLDADAERRKQRKEAGVTGVLHDSYPVRYWDHDLGLACPRALFVGDVSGDPVDPSEWADLTPGVSMPHGVGESIEVAPDGSSIVYGQRVPSGPTGWRQRIVLVDVASGTERVLLDADDAEFASPSFAPDGRRIVCVRQAMSTHDEPPNQSLVTVDLDTGHATDITPEFDRWPVSPQFSAHGESVFFTADDLGHHPLYRVTPGEAPVRLTATGAYTDVQVAPDGSALYALRSSIDSPGTPVRVDPTAVEQTPEALAHPGEIGALPGALTEIEAVSGDGSRVQSWLILPEASSPEHPAPLVLWIHGGPLMSWNAWSWRWCPWLLAARGYAVLMPNPGLSQGFGQDFVRRGWGAWGAEPYTDLMACVDAAIEHPDIDGERTAAMGGSFGGYMANWIATQTDRFDAIVTHASLWHLDGFVGATDASYYWEREFGDPVAEPERYDANSPHRYANSIVTPMLVIHGDKDYRVPIGEGLRLWYDLRRRGVPSRYLYFPDENHWILTPGNARVWYETVFAFLAEHVLGDDWRRPELL